MNSEVIINFISHNKRRIITCICLVMLGLVIYNVAVFRVTGTDPSLSNVPSSSRLLRINFTQPVKSIEGVEIASRPIDDDAIRIEGRSVLIDVPSTGFEADKMTSVRFSKATSSWFGLTTGGYLQRFKPKYIPFNQMSEEQQKAAISASDSAQSNDPFLNNDFPLRTDDFFIEAHKDEGTADISVTITFSKDVPDYDVSPTASEATGDEAEKLKEAALAFIREKGGDPEKYSITYTNKYLSEKYTNELD